MRRPGWRTFVFVWVGLAAGAADDSFLSGLITGALVLGLIGYIRHWWAEMKRIWRDRPWRKGIDLDGFDEGTAEPHGLDLNGFDEGTVKRRDDD